MKPNIYFYRYSIIVLLGMLLPQMGHSQTEDTKKPPPLVVRFIAVARPPLVSVIGGAESQRGRMIDEEAIPPQDLRLRVAPNKSYTLPLMLNVPSRNFLLKGTRAFVLKGNQTIEGEDTSGAFLELNLPDETGVFTVIISRRLGQKHWDNPIVKIVKDTTDTNDGVTRVINLSMLNVGYELGTAKKLIKPQSVYSTHVQKTMKYRSASIYSQLNNNWLAIKKISANPRAGLIQTVICYHGRPTSKKVSALTCHQRIDSIESLKEKIILMEKETTKPEQP